MSTRMCGRSNGPPIHRFANPQVMRVITTTVTAKTSPFWRNWASMRTASPLNGLASNPNAATCLEQHLTTTGVVESCLGAGLTPVVTLNHFTLPRWLATDGGWASPDAALRFAQYASCVTGHLRDLLSRRL